MAERHYVMPPRMGTRESSRGCWQRAPISFDKIIIYSFYRLASFNSRNSYCAVAWIYIILSKLLGSD